MKKLALAFLIVCSLFVGSIYAQEPIKTEAASCAPPTCFWIGGAHVASLKKGWYKSSGMCLIIVRYIAPNGRIIYSDNSYSELNNATAFVYVGNTYLGKTVSLVKVVSAVGWDGIRNKHVYNTCRIFRYVGP
jgi:hypothetical protein